MRRFALNSILKSPHNRRLAVFFGAAFLSLGIFLKLTSEFYEGEVDPLDQSLLKLILELRQPLFNGIAVDITALGSSTLISIFSVIGILILLMVGNRLDALYLISSSVGAAIATSVLKNFILRERPTLIPRLVDVVGFSYPSGHSFAAAAFYFSAGIILMHFLPSPRTRIISFGLIAVVVGLIGLSRIYLGVHYPSDVLSGFLLGTAWALLLAGLFDLIKLRARNTISEGQ